MIGSLQKTLIGRSIERMSKQEGLNRVLAGNYYAVSIAVFSAFLLLSLLRIDQYTLDETVFHYPNLLNFYENGWQAMFNHRYSAANTPLPYLIVATIAKFFSPSLLLARMVTVLISFAGFLLFSKIMEQLYATRYHAFAFLFFPYFFVNSFVFYAVNYGLFFLALGLWQWIKVERSFRYHQILLAGVWFSLAVLCQQFFLVVPLAMAGYKVTRWMVKPSDQPFVGLLIYCSLLLLPLMLPLALFAKWGGLTHSNFSSHSLSFYPSTIVAILFVTGFYFSPYVILYRHKITVVESIASILSATLLVLFWRPVFSDVQGAGLFTGLVFHIFHAGARLAPVIPLVMMFIFTTGGILTFIRLVQQAKSDIEYALLATVLFMTVAFTSNTQVGERHLVGLMMILLLLVLPKMKNRIGSYTLAMAILGSGYFVYWYFFKFS